MHKPIPILVGVAQETFRAPDPAGVTHPIEAMRTVVGRAIEDAACPALLDRADALHVVNMLAWVHRDAPSALADALGMHPQLKEYTAVGGNTPQWLVNRVADNIAAGRSRIAILAGADTMHSTMAAMKKGTDIGAFRDQVEIPLVGIQREGKTAEESAHGADLPIRMYPLLETALRAKEGLAPAAHREALGEFGAAFSAVAAVNPHSWSREAFTPEQVVTPSAENRIVSYPYTKRMCAQPSDMAAALVMTDTETARSLGIPEEKWVYIRGGQDAHDHWFVGHRPDLADSPAIRYMVDDALEQADISLDRIGFFDLYSCFPVMPRLACRVLGIEDGDPRPLTLTGGLPYFGGPGNNYTMHAIVEAVARCRADRDAFGMVTSNGYYATKHGVGIYSAQPPAKPWCRRSPEQFQSKMPLPAPMEVELGPKGEFIVDAYTVWHGRDGAPESGTLCGRTLDGKRAWAQTPPGAVDLLNAMETEEWVGRRGRIAGRDGAVNLVDFS